MTPEQSVEALKNAHDLRMVREQVARLANENEGLATGQRALTSVLNALIDEIRTRFDIPLPDLFRGGIGERLDRIESQLAELISGTRETPQTLEELEESLDRCRECGHPNGKHDSDCWVAMPAIPAPGPVYEAEIDGIAWSLYPSGWCCFACWRCDTQSAPHSSCQCGVNLEPPTSFRPTPSSEPPRPPSSANAPVPVARPGNDEPSFSSLDRHGAQGEPATSSETPASDPILGARSTGRTRDFDSRDGGSPCDQEEETGTGSPASLNLTSCDFCGGGCTDHECEKCYEPPRNAKPGTRVAVWLDWGGGLKGGTVEAYRDGKYLVQLDRAGKVEVERVVEVPESWK